MRDAYVHFLPMHYLFSKMGGGGKGGFPLSGSQISRPVHEMRDEVFVSLPHQIDGAVVVVEELNILRSSVIALQLPVSDWLK